MNIRMSDEKVRATWRKELAPLTIIPKKGVGNICFGMTKEQVDAILGPSYSRIPPRQRVNFIDGFDEFQYVDFVVGFFENQVVEISVNSPVLSCDSQQEMPVTLFGVNVFGEKAEDVIGQLESHAPAEFDCEDRELSSEVVFDSLGIAFWRESVFHPKLLNTPDFQEMDEEELEYQKQFWHFSCVTLYEPHQRDKYFKK